MTYSLKNKSLGFALFITTLICFTCGKKMEWNKAHICNKEKSK